MIPTIPTMSPTMRPTTLADAVGLVGGWTGALRLSRNATAVRFQGTTTGLRQPQQHPLEYQHIANLPACVLPRVGSPIDSATGAYTSPGGTVVPVRVMTGVYVSGVNTGDTEGNTTIDVDVAWPATATAGWGDPACGYTDPPTISPTRFPTGSPTSSPTFVTITFEAWSPGGGGVYAGYSIMIARADDCRAWLPLIRQRAPGGVDAAPVMRCVGAFAPGRSGRSSIVTSHHHGHQEWNGPQIRDWLASWTGGRFHAGGDTVMIRDEDIDRVNRAFNHGQQVQPTASPMPLMGGGAVELVYGWTGETTLRRTATMVHWTGTIRGGNMTAALGGWSHFANLPHCLGGSGTTVPGSTTWNPHAYGHRATIRVGSDGSTRNALAYFRNRQNIYGLWTVHLNVSWPLNETFGRGRAGCPGTSFEDLGPGSCCAHQGCPHSEPAYRIEKRYRARNPFGNNLDRCRSSCIVNDLCIGFEIHASTGYCALLGSGTAAGCNPWVAGSSMTSWYQGPTGSVGNTGPITRADDNDPDQNYRCYRRVGTTASPTLPTALPTLPTNLVCWKASGPVGGNTRSQPNTNIPPTMGPVKAVSTWSSHICAIDLDDVPWCWGTDEDGEATIPAGLERVKTIGVGRLFSCAIDFDDVPWCWGSSTSGRTSIPAALQTNTTRLVVGNAHACGTGPDNEMVCWGHIHPDNQVPSDLGPIDQMSTKAEDFCAITVANEFRCWGVRGANLIPADLGVPKAVSVGELGACAIDQNDRMRCWGNEPFEHRIRAALPGAVAPAVSSPTPGPATFQCAENSENPPNNALFVPWLVDATPEQRTCEGFAQQINEAMRQETNFGCRNVHCGCCRGASAGIVHPAHCASEINGNQAVLWSPSCEDDTARLAAAIGHDVAFNCVLGTSGPTGFNSVVTMPNCSSKLQFFTAFAPSASTTATSAPTSSPTPVGLVSDVEVGYLRICYRPVNNRTLLCVGLQYPGMAPPTDLGAVEELSVGLQATCAIRHTFTAAPTNTPTPAPTLPPTADPTVPPTTTIEACCLAVAITGAEGELPDQMGTYLIQDSVANFGRPVFRNTNPHLWQPMYLFFVGGTINQWKVAPSFQTDGSDALVGAGSNTSATCPAQAPVWYGRRASGTWRTDLSITVTCTTPSPTVATAAADECGERSTDAECRRGYARHNDVVFHSYVTSECVDAEGSELCLRRCDADASCTGVIAYHPIESGRCCTHWETMDPMPSAGIGVSFTKSTTACVWNGYVCEPSTESPVSTSPTATPTQGPSELPSALPSLSPSDRPTAAAETETPTWRPAAPEIAKTAGSDANDATDDGSAGATIGGMVGGIVLLLIVIAVVRKHRATAATAASGHDPTTGYSTMGRRSSMSVLPLPGLVTDAFAKETAFPQVILSYASNSVRKGLGKSYMWALSNVLKESGLTNFNGYMVEAGQNWQLEWYGVLPEAKVVVVMLSSAFFKSNACVKELITALSQDKYVIPLFLEKVSLKGNFLGDSAKAVKEANFIKLKGLSANCIPPPDQGLFQGTGPEDFLRNAQTLTNRIQKVTEDPMYVATVTETTFTKTTVSKTVVKQQSVQPGIDGQVIVINSRVEVDSRAKGSRGAGTVQYIGPHHLTGKTVYGVSLDESSGKNNGMVKGHRYFKCKPGFGILCSRSKLTLLHEISLGVGFGESFDDHTYEELPSRPDVTMYDGVEAISDGDGEGYLDIGTMQTLNPQYDAAVSLL